jgi:hypothetical protein
MGITAHVDILGLRVHQRMDSHHSAAFGPGLGTVNGWEGIYIAISFHQTSVRVTAATVQL